MINLVNITRHYRIRPVLRQVSLKVEGGKPTGLMGPNGMGKSALLGVMAGVLLPQKGYVEINGRRRSRARSYGKCRFNKVTKGRWLCYSFFHV